ncbi:uncharacterized protein LOC108740560 [Agrilus planipennis]|uniref:Uncharacterized protein LOC108740560 n=1 Tax=Agrilus planipennis TaxID=224129 RepID=A0A7F5RJ59_AGRPL|nr:uncharacterized protein LOC108740560 [Agrilus planipennis]
MNVIAILAFFGIITTAYARIRICRKYSLKGIKYPDEKDCSKYYLCRFGLLLSKQCDDGLLYSPVSASCVPPQQSGCKAYERYIDERNKEYCNIAGDSALFPNVLRCNQFYECANGDIYKPYPFI